MAAIVWTDVRALPGAPPALASVDAGMQTVLLSMANAYLDVTIFDGEDGPTTKLARCLYVAHLYAMIALAGTAATVGAVGAVTSESAGKLSREYGSLDRGGGSGMNVDPFSATNYGRTLLTLAWARTRARVL